MLETFERPRLAADGQRGSVHTIHYTLSYWVKGTVDPTKPVVVFLHGFPGDATIWEPALVSFTAYPALVFDLLGNGQSDHPWPADTSVWGHADALNLALRALQLEQVILVGYGLGGGIAQLLATRLMPELIKGLVLIDSVAFQYSFNPDWPLPDMKRRQDPEAWMHTSLDELSSSLRATIPSASANPGAFNSVALDAYVRPYLTDIGKAVFFQQIIQLVPSYLNAVADDLAHLGIPTLVIWGEKDAILPVKLGQRLQRTIPGAQLEIVPGSGHLILNDAPDRVGELVNRFATQIH
jgi:pimeloyl-ACP methyl ester carboxylesterase